MIDFPKLLTNPEAIGTPMLVGLIDEFGTGMFEWEPETLSLEIRDRWKVEVPLINRDKVWALITAITTDAFINSFEGFTHICNSLIGDGASFEVYDPATVQEMAWAVSEVHLVDPTEKGETFNDEILTYMRSRLDYEGFSKPPRILAQWVPDVGTAPIDEALVMDEIDFNAYWDMQQRKRIEVEAFISARLTKLFRDVASLPLKEADPKVLQGLLQRAEKVLGAQLRTTRAAEKSVPATPSL